MKGSERVSPAVLASEDACPGAAGDEEPAFPWPRAWEAWRVPDEKAGEAYEATMPARRALIKATLALVQAFHAEQATVNEVRTEKTSSGFGSLVRRTPAPWALLLLGPGTSPVRLAAAVMPAHLAGVRHIPAVWTGAPADMPAVLMAALELSGIEHVFAPPSSDKKPAGLAAHLARQAGRGRLLLFPGVPDPDLSEFAARADIPVWTDRPVRRIAIQPGARLDEETLLWAHPGAELLSGSGAQAASPDVVFGLPGHGLPRPRFMLQPGLEGLWMHPDLPPAFFLNSETAIFRCGAFPLRA